MAVGLTVDRVESAAHFMVVSSTFMALSVAIVAGTLAWTRKLARIVASGGGTPVVVADPSQLEPLVREQNVVLICGRAEALAQIAPVLRLQPRVHALLFVDHEVPGLLAQCAENAGLNHVLGLRYADATPRGWELLAIMRRWISATAPEPEDTLNWGAIRQTSSAATPADRDAIVEQVAALAETLGGERRGQMIAEAAHELLMNAMYDAPVDDRGRPLYAADRTAMIELSPEQRPRFFWGCDDRHFILSASDPFGRLRREDVFGALHRGLSTGTVDRRSGGAGLGLTAIYRAASLLLFDVAAGRRTQATAVFELDVPYRELRALPRSIHFFSVPG